MKTQISVPMEIDMVEWLDNIARVTNRSRAELIRTAVKDWYDKGKQRIKKTKRKK